MALIKCGECGREVSDKATACPQCGAPIQPQASIPLTREASPPAPKAKTRPVFYVLLGVIAVGCFLVYRAVTNEKAAPPSAGLSAAFRQPQKLVSERVSLKEGQAKMYTFTLRTDARVEVKVEASPKNVDVMLMTA